MIAQIWIFIIRVFNEWYAEMIAVLLGMFIIWFVGLLPSKFQYHKRFNFALKVKKAISKIEVSVQIKDKKSINDLQNELKDFFSKNPIEEIKSNNNELSFFSNDTGVSYTINTIYDEDTEKNFIVINCLNAFSIGFFGGLKGLEDITDELQNILECFNNLRKNKDGLTVHITITPRWKFLKEEGVTVNYTHKNLDTTYTLKNIKIVNRGTSYLKKNIYHVFYDWMVSLL